MKRIALTPWFYYDIYDNGKRIIHVPSPELKRVQRLIMRKYFKPYWTPLSVKDAASVHCGKKWLMKLDIKNFFNSITEEQIKEIISRYVNQPPISDLSEKTRWFEISSAESQEAIEYHFYTNLGSREVSDVEQTFSICTINGKLPTGAPTSPYIANLLLKDFDYDIQEFCYKYGVAYSRYMDDLFFSTDNPQYILSLVELEVLRQIKDFYFELNVPKIKYISSNKRQQVLGLGVNNKKPILTKENKRKYRAYFYNLISPIQFNRQKHFKDKEKEILGHLAYIKSVDGEYYVKIKFYIFNLLVKFNLLKKPCLKNLIRTLNYNKGN